MNSEQLWKCVKQDELLREYCTGIYAIDTTPESFNDLPACYIVNTETYTKPGAHWFAVYLCQYGQHELFDSYGRRQSTLAPTLRKPIVGDAWWLQNTTPIQGPLSDTCGQYCLYYLSKRCDGIQMSEIVSGFSCTRDRIENDEKVNAWVNSKYNTQLDAYDEKFVYSQIATALFFK